MANIEISDSCEFVADCNGITFATRVDGDALKFVDLSLTDEQAASLAWLINHNSQVNVEIKLVGT